MRDRIAEALGGGNQMIENMTRQNLALFENAMAMFSPFAQARTKAAEEATAAPPSKPEDISDLKSEIEAMRKQLAELARERK
jgi:polyhydroxyalkanoate synthesis regulator protein